MSSRTATAGSAHMPPTSLPLLSSRRQVLSAGFAAALGSVAALELLRGSTASARAKATTPATRIALIGDSLTIGTMPYQATAFSDVGWAGSAIDAYGSRGVRTKVKSDLHTGLTAVDAIRTAAGDCDVWVVALGTNDAGIFAKSKHPDLIRQMMDRIGGGHYVIWVNIYLPATPPRQQQWNAALETVAAEMPNEMFVYDWASLAAQNERWLADDQVHCSGKGYMHRSTAIAEATRSLIPTVPPPAEPLRPRRPWLKSLAP
jgi:lysophospholipase L1-like esterase